MEELKAERRQQREKLLKWSSAQLDQRDLEGCGAVLLAWRELAVKVKEAKQRRREGYERALRQVKIVELESLWKWLQAWQSALAKHAAERALALHQERKAMHKAQARAAAESLAQQANLSSEQRCLDAWAMATHLCRLETRMGSVHDALRSGRRFQARQAQKLLQRRLQRAEPEVLLTCWGSWLTLHDRSLSAKELRRRGLRLATRLAELLDQVLTDRCFASWQLLTDRSRAQRGQDSAVGALREAQLSAADQLQEALKSARQERREARLCAKRQALLRIAGADMALLSSSILLWTGAVFEARCSKAAAERALRLRATCAQRIRLAAGKVAVVRELWWEATLFMHWCLQAQLGRLRKQERRHQAKRINLFWAFIWGLRRKLHTQKFLHLWLRTCRPKRRGEVSLSRSGSDPRFLRPPNLPARWPIDYVPSSTGGERLVDYQALMDLPSPRVPQLQAEPALASPRPSSASPPPSRLAPMERHRLASQAAVSDAEYKRLLEQNRRELREWREQAGSADDLFGKRPHLIGWGIWAP